MSYFRSDLRTDSGGDDPGSGGIVMENKFQLRVVAKTSVPLGKEELEQVLATLDNDYTGGYREQIKRLINSELKRRSNAGRKRSSPFTPEEQNRQAQKRYREKHILKSRREIEKDRRKEERLSKGIVEGRAS